MNKILDLYRFVSGVLSEMIDARSRDAACHVSTNPASFLGILGWGLLFFTVACSPVRYIDIETRNPASITFPRDMRRVLIVNNAVAQQDVPFDSDYNQLSDSITIHADSTTFDFCRTLGETISGFAGFDDVRLLEDGFRKDRLPLVAPVMTQDDIQRLCDEHGVDVLISLDRLLFHLKEYLDPEAVADIDVYYEYGMDVFAAVDVAMEGVVRVYLQNRTGPLTTIELADTTTTPAYTLVIEQNDMQSHEIVFSSDKANLLRVSAKILAEGARIHFMPYWNEDIRWYYVASGSRWKEASAYASSERWDKALEIWRTLYDRTPSWKQKARLASNIALGMELTGDLNEALNYAEQSHRLLSGHLTADNPTVERHERYVSVLSGRILEEQRVRLQMNGVVE